MDKSKSLQELENYDQGDPKGAPTGLIKRCLELHRTPLEEWSADDCRLMLGQKFSPQFLVPLALEWLQKDPLEDGMRYPGALLRSRAEVTRAVLDGQRRVVVASQRNCQRFGRVTTSHRRIETGDTKVPNTPGELNKKAVQTDMVWTASIATEREGFEPSLQLAPDYRFSKPAP